MSGNDDTFKVTRGEIMRGIAQWRAPRIVSMELIITEACNLSCSYCFEHGRDRHRSMEAATALAAVDFLVDASRDSSWMSVTFMGGEPLMRYDLIPTVVAHARSRAHDAGKQVHFSLMTNGTLLRTEHLKFFRDNEVRFCLSMDGAPRDHDRYRRTREGRGSFERVAVRMRLLKAYQPWQGVRTTVMPETAARLCRNIRALHDEMSINQFIVGFATGVAWSDRQIADYNQALKEALEYYLEQRIRRGNKRLKIGLLEVGDVDAAPPTRSAWGCGAGSGRIAVAPDGTLHGCSKLAWGQGGCGSAPLPLGSVKTGLERWEDRLRLLDHTLATRVKCRSCELSAFCSGGCYAANYADTGNLYLPSDTYCKLICAQKDACDYGRRRSKELRLCSLPQKTAAT